MSSKCGPNNCSKIDVLVIGEYFSKDDSILTRILNEVATLSFATWEALSS